MQRIDRRKASVEAGSTNTLRGSRENRLEPGLGRSLEAAPKGGGLLLAGAMSAPLFFAVAIVLMLVREGFDIRKHAISTLTLGELGWIQSAAFVAAGCLALLGSIGIRQALRGGAGSVAGPLLIAVYGIGMACAGLFRPDPGMSFPPGAPAGMPATMSVSAAVHSGAFFAAFLALVAACFVLARRFGRTGERGWKAYSIATGLLAPILIAAGSSPGSWIGVAMGAAGLLAFGWLSLLSLRLRADRHSA
ncbi:DUF998 domain-containing protein [Paenibacillus pasadenensis]|uniref:DUF998 domain-containing protein n=1 Tax=Paenibacillus TaxID=44249 RepID=UPI0009FBBD77|nr:DUF998 domain-containing protein [Paenibacillus pasadenensis]